MPNQHRLLHYSYPGGNLTINELDLVAYLAHLHLLAKNIAHLEHMYTLIYNKNNEVLEKRDKSISITAVGTLLRESFWIT